MKFNKKKILALALAACLLGTVSYSTLAWFNASQTVTNKFMVATSGTGLNPNPGDSQPQDRIFSVDLYEVVDVNGDGTIDETTEKIAYRNDATPGWNYEDVLPGVKYHKQPIVENTGAYDQYIRVVVTLTNASGWTQVLPADYDLTKIFADHNEDEWVRDEILYPGLPVRVPLSGGSTKLENDTISYVYYLNKVLPHAAKNPNVDNDHMATLFTSVTLPSELTQEDMAKLVKPIANPNGGFDYELEFAIDIRADAIQTQGLNVTGDTIAEQAKSAFASANWAAGADYGTP